MLYFNLTSKPECFESKILFSLTNLTKHSNPFEHRLLLNFQWIFELTKTLWRRINWSWHPMPWIHLRNVTISKHAATHRKMIWRSYLTVSVCRAKGFTRYYVVMIFMKQIRTSMILIKNITVSVFPFKSWIPDFYNYYHDKC